METYTLYVLASGVEVVGGAKFRVGTIGCPPEPDMTVNMPMGVVSGSPHTGLEVAFSPPLMTGPPGYIFLGSIDVTLDCMCFHAFPFAHLALWPYLGCDDVMIYDSVSQCWNPVSGNDVWIDQGMPTERRTFGAIKLMYH